MAFKRCPNCGISPLPSDIAYFWGQTALEQSTAQCLLCQGKRLNPSLRRPTLVHSIHGCSTNRPRGRAIVVMIDKFSDMPARFLDEHLLGNTLRDTLRVREYGADTFLTDGDRVWRWNNFPTNKASPMNWDHFLGLWPEWDLYEPSIHGIQLMVESDDEEPMVPVVTPFDHIKM